MQSRRRLSLRLLQNSKIQISFTPQVSGIKDNAGIFYEPGAVMKVWEEYFYNLLNLETHQSIQLEEEIPVNQNQIPEYILEEIERVLKTFKTGKTPGDVAIPIKLIS